MNEIYSALVQTWRTVSFRKGGQGSEMTTRLSSVTGFIPLSENLGIHGLVEWGPNSSSLNHGLIPAIMADCIK